MFIFAPNYRIMIVGRVNEIVLREKAYKSNQSEFIAIYVQQRLYRISQTRNILTINIIKIGID